MQREYYVVDVFASEPFSGNPAAVVLGAEGLSERQMQAIAAEFHLSETTFVLPSEGVPSPGPPNTFPGNPRTVRFRWFTPSTEVAMCGHATIAGAHTLIEASQLPQRGQASPPGEPCEKSLRIETRSGTLHARVASSPLLAGRPLVWLDLIDPMLHPQVVATREVSPLLALPADAFDASLPPARTQDGDLLLFVKDFRTLNDARPDFPALGQYLGHRALRGLCLATVGTLTPSMNVQSRFFAPTAGINEDPVTGSVHGPLAVHLVQQGRVPVRDGLAGLVCAQGIPGGRSGVVYALVQPQDESHCAVRIGGQAITTMRGILTI